MQDFKKLQKHLGNDTNVPPALEFFPMLTVYAYTRGKWYIVSCEYVCFTCFMFLFKISLRSGRAVQVFQLLPVARQDLSIVQLQGSTEGATEFKIFMTFLQMIKLKGPKILKTHYSRCWFLLK